MFSALGYSARSSPLRLFSTSAARQWDLAKLTLVGTLVRDPEARLTKSEKEYVSYTVATQNYPPPQADVNGDRPPTSSTFHRVVSFSDNHNRYLKNLRKGSKVYVEANFELRDPEPGADPTTPRGQRQIFLKHEMLRVISAPWTGERTHAHNSDEPEPF